MGDIYMQVLGYGWAGLLRKYVVEPAHMWWPNTLVQISLFRYRTLVKNFWCPNLIFQFLCTVTNEMSPKSKLLLPLATCLDLELLDHNNKPRKNVFSLKMLVWIKLVVFVMVLQPKWPAKLQYSNNLKKWLEGVCHIFEQKKIFSQLVWK